jgi:hypothetical protein
MNQNAIIYRIGVMSMFKLHSIANGVMFTLSIIVLYMLFQNDSFGQDTLYIFPSRQEIDVLVGARVEENLNHCTYEYQVRSLETSKQNVEEFFVEFISIVDTITSPNGWMGFISDLDFEKNIVMWGSDDTTFDISPNNQLGGFVFVSSGLPTIVSFYCRGAIELPIYPDGGAPPLDSVIGVDIFENSKSGFTIGPTTPPTPFNALTFLDTITSYISESRTLGWITNDPTASKYKRLIDTARFHLQANNRGVAKAKLDSVMVSVYPDSAAGLITSEAYALLRFNTEYLLKKLSDEEERLDGKNK